jgi:hypothetical protein
VRWDSAGTDAIELTVLGTNLAGHTNARAIDINDAGIIVGSATKYDALGEQRGLRATVWAADDAILELNTLIAPGSGWLNLYRATDISDTNWVTGIGTFDPDGAGGQEPYVRAFLVQVPEPSTCVALLGLACLNLRRRGGGGRGENTRTDRGRDGLNTRS